MKKVFLFALLALMGVTVLFTSCDNEEVEAGPVPEATVIGKVKAELNTTNSELEFAPVGTKIYFRIKSQQLTMDPLPNYNYQTLQYETTVDANGEYNIKLPCATHQAVNVTIVPVNFRLDKVTSDTTSVDYYYNGVQSNVNIIDGEIYYKDLMYN